MTDKIPTTWAELIREHEPRLESECYANLTIFADQADNLLAIPSMLPGQLMVSATPLARPFVIAGAAAKPYCLLDKAAKKSIALGAEVMPNETILAATYIAMMKCFGMKLPPAAKTIEVTWLETAAQHVEELQEHDRRTAALACVACGQPKLVAKFDGGGPLRPTKQLEDANVAGPNVFGFARHLAEVLASKGAREHVETAWSNFVQAFPLTLASRGARFVDFVWAAIAITTQLEGKPHTAVLELIERATRSPASQPKSQRSSPARKSPSRSPRRR